MAIEQIERLPDVSFIDDDINLDGIQKQMLQDYQDKYMEETGEETVLDRGEPIALILYACSVQIYQMYMYVDRAGKQNLLKYAFGAFLDNLAALKGIERTAAKPATVTMRFTLSEAQTGAIAIPAGTRVTDGEAYFTTDEYAEIKAGETTVDVACTSIETGVDLNGIHEGAIQTLVDPIPYIESVTNITETDGGADPESDESLKDRIYIAPSRYSTAGTEEAYCCNKRVSYADDTYTGDYQKLGYVCATNEGFIKKMGFDSLHPEYEMPVEVGGGADSYVGDYYYSSEGGTLVFSGARVLSGANAGPFYRNCDSGTGYLHWDIGGRPHCRKAAI